MMKKEHEFRIMNTKIKKGTHYGAKGTNIFLSIVILLVMPLVVFTLITSKTNKLAGIQSFVVITGSMEPKIPTGAVVFTKPQSDYKLNDVIAFNRGDAVVTHRIVDVAEAKIGTSFTTKGDANSAIDQEAVLGASIVGKEMVSIPYLGLFIKFLSTIQGFILFIVLPISIFILLELWNIKKEMEKSIEAKLIKKMEVQTSAQ